MSKIEENVKTLKGLTRYLESLFTERYLKDLIARNNLLKTNKLDGLTNVLASNIGALTNPTKLEATSKSINHSSISANTISAYIGYLTEASIV